ncbi:hypothetical protein MMC14_000059 [Varicellaria rhodocarpa]|nr:hypothetical protein [Varicellaria rhodocarpa]
MSTAVYPPIFPHDLIKAEEATLARELQWLLSSLQETLASFKSGLEECVALLVPTEPGSTLVVSSLRSESVKGFVTRVGTRIVKGDISLRLPTLPPPPRLLFFPLRLSTLSTAPSLVLTQLTSVRNLINQCLDVVDISTWTGDAHDAHFISGQLRLLLELIQEARQTLKGGEPSDALGKWWESCLDENIFSPTPPPTLALTLSIHDASLILHIRTLQLIAPSSLSTTTTTTPSTSFLSADAGLSLRQRLGLAAKLPEHDESNRIFIYKGQEVRVREKVRVDSQDPSLMAVMAKLSALEHGVRCARRGLGVVMMSGGEDDE